MLPTVRSLPQIDKEIKDKTLRLRVVVIATVQELNPLPEWTRVYVRKSKRHQNRHRQSRPKIQI